MNFLKKKQKDVRPCLGNFGSQDECPFCKDADECKLIASQEKLERSTERLRTKTREFRVLVPSDEELVEKEGL